MIALGRAIRERRAELGMTQKVAAEGAGIAENTWGEYERGLRSPRAVNAYRVDIALHWPQNTTSAIVNGERRPTGAQTVDPTPASDVRPLGERVAALEALVERQGRDLSELRALIFGRGSGVVS